MDQLTTPITDWAPYTVPQSMFNGTRNQAHRMQGMLKRAGFAGARAYAEHATNGKLMNIPELDALEEAEASGRLASADTLKGMNQRTQIETNEGTAAQTLVGWDGPGISLNKEGLPLDLPVNLMLQVKRNPEDTPESINVGENMRKFEETIAKSGDIVGALKDLFTQPCQAFKLNVDKVVADYCYAAPGVREAVLAGTPEASS